MQLGWPSRLLISVMFSGLVSATLVFGFAWLGYWLKERTSFQGASYVAFSLSETWVGIVSFLFVCALTVFLLRPRAR
jgi:hypothetical protein